MQTSACACVRPPLHPPICIRSSRTASLDRLARCAPRKKVIQERTMLLSALGLMPCSSLKASICSTMRAACFDCVRNENTIEKNEANTCAGVCVGGWGR